MKEQNKRIFILNLFFSLCLVVLYDPFNAYPKEYSKAPAWLTQSQIDSIDQIKVKWEDETDEYSFILKKEKSFWTYSEKENSEPLFCDQDKVILFLTALSGWKRFERDSKILKDEEFLKEGSPGRLSLLGEGKIILDWEWGKCYRNQTDCLVRAKGASLSFQIPAFLPNHLGFSTDDFFLSDRPFFHISPKSINFVEYSLGGQIRFGIRKEKETWVLESEEKNKLNNSSVDSFLLRIVSWGGESGFLKKHLSPEFLSGKEIQKLKVGYLDEENQQEYIEAVDMGIFKGNYKLLRVEPRIQYIIMPSYSWEYFRFFDTKQLQN
ncbi:hypothetical protein [Leptospira idonii]|uniref:DUF4340 domain-containing protein n=1 Tax=Leptospira idonii TaxID=1193500 RepID=A0A4R9M5A1_9LEPT|nr:hypothetical protein [Leptospira idonii]TGN20985.1 hypothetical protein EHS15_00225 [Leptospira idonii]